MMPIKLPNPQDILFLRGDINYTEFHLVDGKKVISSSTLLRHQERLDGFLRVSRKYLINPRYISEIENSHGVRQVLMLNGQRIAVARRRKNKLK